MLSVNSSNLHQAADWGAEVVVIPDSTDASSYRDSIAESIAYLEQKAVPYRIDPILEPIGYGFAASLERYRTIREAFPDAAMMMGIGNITELTDCDSAGLNLMLLAICEEWRITSILTTQVIPWAKTSVRECDVARRMLHYAIQHRIPPKRLDARLVMLRDPRIRSYSPKVLISSRDHHR